MGCIFLLKRIECQKPRPVVLCSLIHIFILIFFKRCGTGAIVGYWENILLMVGPQKDWVKYPYNEKLTNAIVFRFSVKNFSHGRCHCWCIYSYNQ